MAVELLSSLSSPVQACRRSKEGRSRPNLSRVCNRTKMCSFHMRGMCTRGDTCSFAHDPSQVQEKPDLTCTKLCPALLSEGQCSRGSRCKFAHSEAELRTLEPLDVLPSFLAISEPSWPSSIAKHHLSSFENSPEQLNTTACGQLPRTAPQVVSQLKDVALSGALTLGEMVSHLTCIFASLYEVRPEIADQVGVPPSVLASSTAEQAWADAGIDCASLMKFQDFARWCALPFELMSRDGSLPILAGTHSEGGALHPQLNSGKDDASNDVFAADSDAWSQCSTDDCNSDRSLRTPIGCQTPASCEDLEDACCEHEITVMNTFIHVSIANNATKSRRARSVPGRRVYTM